MTAEDHAVSYQPESICRVMATAKRSLRSKFIIEVTGSLRVNRNDKCQLVQLGLNVAALTVLNTAKLTPFEVGWRGNDDTRLRYRYLDLRRRNVGNLKLRAR